MPVEAESLGVDFLVDLATRFYVRGQTQADIARSLDLDPSTVSRQLKKARDEGIVRVEIRRPQPLHVTLGRELADCYRLKRSVVAASPPSGARGDIGDSLARVAADYLSSQLTNRLRVGLAWGGRLAAAVRALPAEIVSELQVAILVGGAGATPAIVGVQGHDLAQHLVALYPGTRVTYLHAPAVVATPAIKQALLQDDSISGGLQAAARSEIAVLGVGRLANGGALIRNGYLSQTDLRRLDAAGAIGDFCARYFRPDGEPVPVLDDRVIALDREQLRAIPMKVAIAGGPGREAAIRGALLTGCIDVLVTDEGTATALLGAT